VGVRLLTTLSSRGFLACWLLSGFAWLCLIGQASADEMLPRTDPKVRQAEQVYRNLLRVIGDNRTPPEFRMVRGKASTFDIAMFSPKHHRVVLEERFYDLAQSLPPSIGSHALALIIGHELAHFYRSHPWAIEFGRAFADRQRDSKEPGELSVGQASAANVAERRRIETEADYFGGFYSFLAGYHPLAVSSHVFDAVYREYKFDDSLPAYEHLKHRKAAAQNAQAQLQQLVPLFEAGLYLSAIKDHLNAARVFDRIAADFPGPEMFNNAGVALANESLRWGPEAARRFIYPFELDSDTRLSEEEGRGGTGAGEEEREQRRIELLEQAKVKFEKVAVAFPSYATAAVNHAAVLDLLGQYDLALGKTREALVFVGKEGLNNTGRQAHLVEGIAAAHLGRIDEARKAFLAARTLGSPFAEGNLAVLSGHGIREGGPAHADEIARNLLQPEQVGGLNIADVRIGDLLAGQDSKVLGRWDADEEQTELQIFRAKKGPVQVTAVLRGPASKRSRVIWLSADPGSQGKSLRGISVGQSVAQLEERYGAPGSVIMSRQGMYHLYENRYRGSLYGFMVRIDGLQLIRDWVVYRIEE